MDLLGKIGAIINGLRQYNYVPPKQEPGIADTPALALPSTAIRFEGCVWHHSESKDNPLGNDFETVRRYHMSYRIDGNIVTEAEFDRCQKLGLGNKFQKPWSNIAYHYFLERDNGILQIKIGRSLDTIGAHAGIPGNNFYNEKYIGICLAGNYNRMKPDAEAWQMCIKLTKDLMAQFGFPKENVIGHREVYAKLGVPQEKTCPGLMFSIEQLRASL